MKNSTVLGSSFRDPSGFVFEREGVLYRQVNQAYAEQYSRLMQSGLYARLTRDGLLVPHEEADVPPPAAETAFRILRPRRVPFISYPYEWPFSMLKEAALTTLAVQKQALAKGLILKDASAYNIQLVNGRPALIDTLSFEEYQDGKPWDGYRQFCQHFLAPLALMAYKDVRLGQLLKVHVDGIPLDLAASLLPGSARLNFGLLVHIFLHAGLQRSQSDRPVKAASRTVTRETLLALADNLEAVVRKLDWKPGGTEWGGYYGETNYSEAAFQQKRELVSEWIAGASPATVWDLGGNDGTFSRLVSQKGIYTVCFDIDPAAVEANYRTVRKDGDCNLLPLILDLSNPSPALGWHERERDSLLQRGPADLILALALIHHLAISNNVPLRSVADFFADAGGRLIIEFVPKSDSQVQRLLRTRKDIFDQYSIEGFEAAFAARFNLIKKAPIAGSERWLYLMERK
jgi:ribosomal protein L11 methylase PrmA